jgi:hypothetical protein
MTSLGRRAGADEQQLIQKHARIEERAERDASMAKAKAMTVARQLDGTTELVSPAKTSSDGTSKSERSFLQGHQSCHGIDSGIGPNREPMTMLASVMGGRRPPTLTGDVRESLSRVSESCLYQLGELLQILTPPRISDKLFLQRHFTLRLLAPHRPVANQKDTAQPLPLGRSMIVTQTLSNVNDLRLVEPLRGGIFDQFL